MTDIVERLRSIDCSWSDEGELAAQAADEIERLRKIEAAAKNLISVKGRHNTEIAYQRLRGAMGEE